jgi:hypothetical protein
LVLLLLLLSSEFVWNLACQPVEEDPGSGLFQVGLSLTLLALEVGIGQGWGHVEHLGSVHLALIQTLV